MNNAHAAILVLVMAAVTMLLRFFPFIVFRKNTPDYVVYLGRVLPAAIIGMLVVYCLRNVTITGTSHGLPELIAGTVVVLLQWKKRNSLLSILCGTILYMAMVHSI